MAYASSTWDSAALVKLNRKQLLHYMKGQNIYAWLSERPGGKGFGIADDRPAGEVADEINITAISGAIQYPIPYNNNSYRLRDNTAIQYSQTAAFKRLPYANSIGMDPYQDTRTYIKSRTEASKALADMAGRRLQDIVAAALGVGQDTTTVTPTTVKTDTPHALASSLRRTDVLATNLDRTGIGTPSVAAAYSHLNVWFVKDDALVRPQDVTTTPLTTHILTNPAACKMSFKVLEKIGMAARSRYMQGVDLTVEKIGRQKLFALIVPPYVFQDLVDDADRKEMQKFAEVRGLENSWFRARPSFIYHAGVLVVEAANYEDRWSPTAGTAITSAPLYPGFSPLLGQRIAAHPYWTWTELQLLGLHSYAYSQYEAGMTITEGEDEDAKTKPWLATKYTVGAGKTVVALPNDTKFNNCGSVICAAYDDVAHSVSDTYGEV